MFSVAAMDMQALSIAFSGLMTPGEGEKWAWCADSGAGGLLCTATRGHPPFVSVWGKSTRIPACRLRAGRHAERAAVPCRW